MNSGQMTSTRTASTNREVLQLDFARWQVLLRLERGEGVEEVGDPEALLLPACEVELQHLQERGVVREVRRQLGDGRHDHRDVVGGSGVVGRFGDGAVPRLQGLQGDDRALEPEPGGVGGDLTHGQVVLDDLGLSDDGVLRDLLGELGHVEPPVIGVGRGSADEWCALPDRLEPREVRGTQSCPSAAESCVVVVLALGSDSCAHGTVGPLVLAGVTGGSERPSGLLRLDVPPVPWGTRVSVRKDWFRDRTTFRSGVLWRLGVVPRSLYPGLPRPPPNGGCGDHMNLAIRSGNPAVHF
jgi:hypothetical protein